MPPLGSTLGVVGWFALVTIAAFYGILKATKWSLNTEQVDVRHPTMADDGQQYPSLVDHIKAIWQAFLVALLAVVTWPGLSSWAYDAWHWILAQL